MLNCLKCRGGGEIAFIGTYTQPCSCLDNRLIDAVKFFGWGWDGKVPEFALKRTGWKLGNGTVVEPFTNIGIIPNATLDSLEVIEDHISNFMKDVPTEPTISQYWYGNISIGTP